MGIDPDPKITRLNFYRLSNAGTGTYTSICIYAGIWEVVSAYNMPNFEAVVYDIDIWFM